VNEIPASRPTQFLANLATAMRSAAEAARGTTLAECRASATEYMDGLKTLDGSDLHKAADEDVAIIREQAETQLRELREATDARIAERRRQLVQVLAQLHTAQQARVDRAAKQVAAFEAELSKFFAEISEETNPTIFASMAAQMPDPPEFGEPETPEPPGPTPPASKPTPATAVAAAAPDESTSEAQASEPAPVLPDHWWLDSPTTLRTKPHGA
jgi:hypothetical protein